MNWKTILAVLLTAVLLTGCGTADTEEEPSATALPIQEETEAITQTDAEETTAPQAPVVTKDPTGETLSPGGTTWFIAHAENATILTWEFVAPDGTVYSVNETMSLNSGLGLDISTEDTVKLQNVPLSLNGWSVRARFDGPGGSVTTQEALITVIQSQGAYDAVIEKYRAAMEHKDETNVAEQYDVSEMIFYASHVGYAVQDLDGDGVNELILAGIGYDSPDDTYLFDIYTLSDGTPISVGRSTVLSLLYLMSDGKIYCEGSRSDSGGYYSIMQYSGGTLQFLNGLYSADIRSTADAPDGLTYFYTTSNQYGDLTLVGGDSQMEEKVATTFLNTWRDMIILPELCLIA